MNKLLKYKKVTGVDYLLQSNGEFAISGIVVEEKKSILQIEDSFNENNKTELLKSKIDLNTPLSLIIHGKGVLHKKIEAGISDKKTILQQLFPTSKIQDFYIQQFHLNKQNQFVSIIRKQQLDNILSEFQRQGFYIVAVSLGPFPLNSVIPLLQTSSKNTLEIANFQFNILNGALNDCRVLRKTSIEIEEYEVGNLKITHQQLLAFSAAFQAIVYKKGNLSFQNGVKNRKEWQQKQLFRYISWSILVGLLSILVINFLLFSHFSQRSQDLQSLSGQYQATIIKMGKLQNQISNQQKFIQQTGSLQSSKASFYADQIAYTLNKNIQLTQLKIHPIVFDRDKSNPLSFQLKKIEIQGTCKKSTHLNDWLKQLKILDWVKNVKTKNFSQKNEYGVFIVNLETL